jgi:serine/threonine-protein kinase HipA
MHSASCSPRAETASAPSRSSQTIQRQTKHAALRHLSFANQRRAEYHQKCIDSLFGTSHLPTLNVNTQELYALAAKMAGKMSISGVQEKVSLKLSKDKASLAVAASGGRYILKPEPNRFSGLPQIEHLTMRLATLTSIEIPPVGLIRLSDDSLAYVIKRFDRLDDGKKLQVEDFCQLSEKPIRDKYDGSAELCVRLLRKYASEPLIEVWKLYRLLLFAWWTGNSDLHLKNISILTTTDGVRRLSPAYDLVCTRIFLPDDDRLAIPIGGRDKNFTRRRWLEFAEYCAIPEKAAVRLLSEQIEALSPAKTLIGDSFVRDEAKAVLEEILIANATVLKG